jgi:hypothetical protein
MLSFYALLIVFNGFRNALIKAVEAHVRIVEHCLRLSNSTSASQYFLASCFAVFDRSWLAVGMRVEERRNAHRTMLAHQRERVDLAIKCSDLMKKAVRSEFAGDNITARVWISAISTAGKNNRVFGSDFLFNPLVSIRRIMQGNREESTKRLRDAILLAEKLRWRRAAFTYLSSEGCVNAERASECADVVAECLHRLLSPHDKAETILLEAAVAAAEPRVLQFYLGAEVQLPPSLVDEVVRLLHRAKYVASHRQEVARYAEELESLVARRSEYQLPRLIDVYDEFIAVSRLERSHSVECLAKLEAGDFHSVVWSEIEFCESHFADASPGGWLGAQHFFQEKLKVIKPAIQQVENASRKVAELRKSSDKTSQLESRCWARVSALLNAVLDPVLSTPYTENTCFRRFEILQCFDAELAIMVVESLVGAARQYETEIRAEWRPEVASLLEGAARWAQTCAEKTLDSIEAAPSINRVQGRDWVAVVNDKWSSCYHEASDRCAMLYARGAAELRTSYDLARSHNAVDHIRATIYRVASEASTREASLVECQGFAPEGSDQQQVSEVNDRCVSLAHGLPVQCDSALVQLYLEWARRALSDQARITLHIARQAHNMVMEGTAVELQSFMSYLQWRQIWADYVNHGTDGGVTRGLRAVLDQFECEDAYDVNLDTVDIFSEVRVSSSGRVNVLGEVVGLKLAETLLPIEVRVAAPAGPAMCLEDQEFLQTHVDRVVRLAKLLFDVSADSALQTFPAELEDTRKSLVCGIQDAYEEMTQELQLRAGHSDDGRMFRDTNDTVSEYKTRVLALLPSQPSEVALRLWQVFPRGNTYCELVGVDPSEYETLVDSLLARWFAPLDAIVLIRTAEAACLEYWNPFKWQGRGDHITLEIHKLGVKRARLDFYILVAQRLGDETGVACLKEAQQHIDRAVAVAKEIVALPRRANAEQQLAQMERHVKLAETAQLSGGRVSRKL